MIKIIAGVYGLRRNGKVEPITAKSEPITLAKAEEARLVKAGVAVYVDGAAAPEAKVPEAKAPETKETKEPKAEEKRVEDLSYNELKSKAAAMGLTVEGNKKQDFINAINEAAEGANTEGAEAPTFDAGNTVID
jgi:hypothetical protein